MFLLNNADVRSVMFCVFFQTALHDMADTAIGGGRAWFALAAWGRGRHAGQNAPALKGEVLHRRSARSTSAEPFLSVGDSALRNCRI